MISSETKKQIVICPDCTGHGILTTREFGGHSEGWYRVNKPCTTCGGSGKLLQTTIIKHEKCADQVIDTE